MKKITPYELERIYMIEKMVTDTLNGERRAVGELHTLMPELFIRGTKTYTILEPFLHESEKIK